MSVHFFGDSKVVALDISKAIDRVWHQGLISKVKNYGVGNTFIRWLSDFLCNHSIQAVIDRIHSNFYAVYSGVPQGLVISPTLFLLFLNYLLCLTTNPIYSFADDSSLCHSYSYNAHPNPNEVGVNRNYMDDTLNSDLVKSEEWGRVNRVEFNARKTQCCLLSHKRTSNPGWYGNCKIGDS